MQNKFAIIAHALKYITELYASTKLITITHLVNNTGK